MGTSVVTDERRTNVSIDRSPPGREEKRWGELTNDDDAGDGTTGNADARERRKATRGGGIGS
eukprot:31419-Pelagococcus_subviridis.AAC.21